MSIDPQFLLELVGYLASILVAVSLMMRSILRLRLINLVGAVVFTVYGLLIGAYPVAVVNFFIIIINLYYLYQMRSAKEYFRLLEVPASSKYLRYFLSHYRADIQTFQPDFAHQDNEQRLAFFVLRNMVPAGLILGRVSGSSMHLELDYAIPGYRDFRIARFVFQDQANALRERGIREVYTEPGSPSHTRYLERSGFKPVKDSAGGLVYCLRL